MSVKNLICAKLGSCKFVSLIKLDWLSGDAALQVDKGLRTMMFVGELQLVAENTSTSFKAEQ
jgi:hypothetical protein